MRPVLLFSLLCASVVAQDTSTDIEAEQTFSIVAITAPTASEPDTFTPIGTAIGGATIPGIETIVVPPEQTFTPTYTSVLTDATIAPIATGAPIESSPTTSYYSISTIDPPLVSAISAGSSSIQSINATLVNGGVGTTTCSTDVAVTVTTTRIWTSYCGCSGLYSPGLNNQSITYTSTSTAYSTLTSTYSSGSTLLPNNTISPIITYTSYNSSTSTFSTSYSSGSVLLPNNTITPSSTSTSSGSGIASATLTGTSSTSSTGITTSSTSTSISSTTTSATTTTSTTTPATTTSSTTTSSTTISSSLTTTPSTTTSSAITTTTTTTTSATTTSAAPVVTDQAYIDTVIRHHTAHRANSSANPLTWSPSLADIARQIAQSCVYQHDTTTGGGGYGQNIGAGYPSNMMGAFVTEGLYNPEEPNYTAYGAEPNYNDLSRWGHFTQVVWKGTTSVGCYTYDCTSAGGLQNAPGIPPYFTVCNYAPAGNVVGGFATNVGQPLGAASIDASYLCPSRANCVG